MTSEPGNLTSPGFPRNYPSNLNCRWIFGAENETQKVLLKFTYLKLEQNYDVITIYQEQPYNSQQILLTGSLFSDNNIVYDNKQKHFRKILHVM